MDCRLLISFALLTKLGCPTAGKLIVRPRDTDVKVNQSTYFNCSTDYGLKDIFWFHGVKYVYTGSTILDPYHERFKIDRNVWNGTYIYNLVIHSVQPSDAGKYTCHDDEEVGDKFSAQLIVLDNDPTCQSDIQADGVIGQNVFNIPPDEVLLTCNLIYHGEIAPQMVWKKVGENSATKDGVVSHVRSHNRLIYSLKLKGDISLENSSYICQTTRSTQNQYKCASENIKVLYFIGGNTTQQIVVRGAEISCIASNNTFPCISQWYRGDYTCPLSCADIITAHLVGEYLCTVKCHVRGRDYTSEVMNAVVLEPTTPAPPSTTESSHTKTIVISVVVIVGVMLVVVGVFIVVFGRILKRKAAHTEESQLKLLDELSPLPTITDQNMVGTLAVNQHFIDRGTSGAIYGPFRWKIKKCVFKQILFSPDQLTKDMEDNIHEQADRYKKLDHEHLVKVFDVWFPLPALYILMEYAEGKSLDKILRPKDASYPLTPFSNYIIRNWATQIADGMEYLHFKTLVHRNLKAAHVLVMESPDVRPNTLKIGLGSYTRFKQHDHATFMSIKETMNWMAPEYIRGEPFSKLSDVWSYGVTVWEILTRDVPFNEVRTETDLARAAIKETLKLKIPDSCPKPLQELLTDCWNYEVNKRPSFTRICDYLRETRNWAE